MSKSESVITLENRNGLLVVLRDNHHQLSLLRLKLEFMDVNLLGPRQIVMELPANHNAISIDARGNLIVRLADLLSRNPAEAKAEGLRVSRMWLDED